MNCLYLPMCLLLCDEDYKMPTTCKQIPIKRYFLPLIGVFALATLPEFRHFIYLPIVVIFGFFILFWNFPFIVYYTASKPLYYEDLFIDEKKLPNYEVDKRIKHKFQMILEFVLILTNALLTGALADYYIYKTSGEEGYMKILGVTGGIIKIFQMINNTISRLMLKILKRCIKMENRKFKKKQIEGIEKIIRLKRHQSNIWKDIELPKDIELQNMNNLENIKIMRERADTL